MPQLGHDAMAAAVGRAGGFDQGCRRMRKGEHVLWLALAMVMALLPAVAVHAVGPSDEALDWIAGRWCAAQGDAGVDEYWLPPVAGETQGLSRTVRDDRVVAFEFMRIEMRDGVQTFLAQPQGRAETAFARSAGGFHWVRFENPAHDFPDRIEYRRDGDALRAVIEGPEPQGRPGARAQVTLAYRRCGAGDQPEASPRR